MKGKTLTALFLLLCSVPRATAQDGIFVDSRLDVFAADPTVPYVGLQIPLHGSYADTLYSADIEFPELVPVTEEDMVRWGINREDVPSWPRVESFVGVSKGNATLDVGFVPLLKRGGQVFKVASYKPVVRKTVRPLAGAAVPSAYTRESVLSEGRWVKIRIPETGIYRLTDKFLKSAGFQNPEKVRLFGYGGAVLPEQDIRDLQDDLPEQPLMQFDGYRLFYAQGPVSWTRTAPGVYEHRVNTYSDWGYYFLTDSAPGAAATPGVEESDTVTGHVVNRFPDYYAYDPDEFSWYRSGCRFFESYDYANGAGRTYQLSLPGIIPDSVLVSLAFSSACSQTSRLTVSVDGRDVHQADIPAKSGLDEASVMETEFLCTGAFSSDSRLRILHDRPSGTSAHLDYIRLNFQRKLALYGSSTLFRVESDMNNISFSIDSSTPDVQIWKMSQDGRTNIVPSSYSGGRTLTLAADYLSSDRLMAVDTRAVFPEPEYVGQVESQNLHALDSIDMVIVVPASGKLAAQAGRLAAAHREIDGISVFVTKADAIYNEFSSGTPDATAIRRFMKMLYDRGGAAGGPRYLLLMGDGAWDNRMHVSDWVGNSPDDYLLCYESYNSVSETASYVMEDYFGLLDDTEGRQPLKEKVDLGVGRLPVVTERQAVECVDKLVSYMKGDNRGAWQNRILVLGDDGDNNRHMTDADDVAGVYAGCAPDMDLRKIYWDSYRMEVSAAGNSYPSVRRALLDELDRGALIVNYSGHGSTEVLSHELVLNKADMAALKSPRLPFWITASCDIAPFDASVECIGRNLMLNPQGGAIGMLSTTRTVYASLNRLMNMSFSKYVLAGDSAVGRYAVGDALRLAKNTLVTPGSGMSDMSENKIHFVLLGDPALKLDMARLTAVVDSFAHHAAADTANAAMAGAVITVSGHIECDGIPVPEFRGLLSATVFDAERHVVTFDNAGSADAPFEYDCRDRVLYSGSDSVRNGSFGFSFPVPMDIGYSFGTGRISLFACTQDRTMTANGTYSNFTVGGTDPSSATDSTGPDMQFYLNTPSFQYGGKVNSSPLLIADLHDDSGLNTSGIGLGHDILLVIDNDPNFTYVLNSCFTQTPGDYTGGRVVFSIPSLPEGKHTMMLRAWDVKNNSATRYLEFTVVDGLPARLSVEATDNPATEGTTFLVQHDRPGQGAQVAVHVYDTRGVLQWTGSTDATSDSGISQIYWNLTGSSGHRMQPGVYIFYATVGSDGGTARSESGKLIVTGR